jgi:hypothetical protein
MRVFGVILINKRLSHQHETRQPIVKERYFFQAAYLGLIYITKIYFRIVPNNKILDKTDGD